MQITGTIHKIFDTQEFTNFRKREFVVIIADNPQYPQYIKLEASKDRFELLNNFNIGDTISVEFNLRGREVVNQKGETVYFNSIEAWKINKV